MKCRKHILGVLLILAMIFSLFPYQPAKAANKDKKYLVIFIDEKGNCKGIKNLVELDENGERMIRAKKFAQEVGLTYESIGKGEFSLTNEKTDESCIYIIDETEYTYLTDSDEKTRTATSAPAVIDDRNMVHYKALTPMLYSKYFSAKKAPAYKSKGYDGVICFANHKLSDTDLPSIGELKNAEDLKLYTLNKKTEKNLVKLKNYFQENRIEGNDSLGVADSFYRNNLYVNYGIIYEPKNDLFSFINITQDYQNDTKWGVIFSWNSWKGDIISVQFIFIDSLYQYTCEGSAKINIKTYSGQTLKFSQTIYGINADQELKNLFQSLGNSSLSTAMPLYNILLKDTNGMSLSDIGFLKYK